MRAFIYTIMAALLCHAATAQVNGETPGFPEHLLISGPIAGNGLGGIVPQGPTFAVLGDISGDGLGDLIIGVPGSPFFNSGNTEIRAVSGADGSVLYAIPGAPAASGATSGGPPLLGTVIRHFDDFNGDAIDDFGSMELTTNGFALRIRSGINGSLISSFGNLGTIAPTFVSIDDLTNDGVPEVCLRESLFDRLNILDGSTGASIQTIVNPGAGLQYNFGALLWNLGDISGDGLDDLAAASNAPNFVSPIESQVRIFESNAATGYQPGPVYSVPGLLFNVFAAPFGDTDNDGHDDYLICVTDSCTASGPDLGTVKLMSGATHSVIWQISNPVSVRDTWGYPAIRMPDVDGDGVDDIVIAATQGAPDPLVGRTGLVYVYSGRDRRLLFRLIGPEDLGPSSGVINNCTGIYSPLWFGGHLFSGNFNGDSLGDLVVGFLVAGGGAGAVHVFSGTTVFDPITAAGNVMAPGPGQPIQDVLFAGVAGSNMPSSGGDARALHVPVGVDIGIWVAAPWQNGGAPTAHAIFGKIVEGGDHGVFGSLPFGIGAMCFTPEVFAPWTTEPLFTLTNTFGGWPALLPAAAGAGGGTGIQVAHTRAFPFPATFWLQGFVQDAGKPWPGISITNAMRIVVF